MAGRSDGAREDYCQQKSPEALPDAAKSIAGCATGAWHTEGLGQLAAPAPPSRSHAGAQKLITAPAPFMESSDVTQTPRPAQSESAVHRFEQVQNWAV